MADIYPRVFTPNLNFSTVTATLSPAPGNNDNETRDGEAPSKKENLADFDPLLRFYTAGTDAKAYTWSFTQVAAADQEVNAVAFLGFFLSAQSIGFSLRNGSGVQQEHVAQAVPLLTGKAALYVAEMSQTRAIRQLVYSIAQPASKRSVIGFALPGGIESLERTPSSESDDHHNLPRVIDPYSPPIDQAEYSVFRYLASSVSVEDLNQIRQWVEAGPVLVELEYGDWRMGSFDVERVLRNGTVFDVYFRFVEQLL